MFSVAESEIGNISFVISNWLSDAMIVRNISSSADISDLYLGLALCGDLQRLRSSALDGHDLPWDIVWRLVRYVLGSTVIPSNNTARLALGLLWLLQISNSSPWGGTINWTLPYLSVSLGLNVIITLAIICRLFLFRRRIAGALGGNYGSQYLSLAAILVESAALYSSFCLLFLVPFGLNHYISTIFLQSLCQVQVTYNNLSQHVLLTVE